MDGHFKQVVMDAVNELKNKGTSYCFSLEQFEEIQKHFKSPISYHILDGIYYLKKK